MDNVKNDNYYIQKIKKDLEFIVVQMQNTDLEELNTNEILLDSMLFRMIQLSENAKRLSEEYKNLRKNIPWNAMYGLRNRIVHDYGNVDLSVVYETLKNDIPELLEKFKERDIKSYAAHLDGKTFYDKVNYQGGTAILIGNEGNGLRSEVAQKADVWVQIPMCGQVESLNAAIAASVFMFEVFRQRR